MFRSRSINLRFQPQNGLAVIVAGNISVYETDGVYQFYVDSMTVEGIGGLALAYEQLKQKMMTEGLFDTGHKKILPKYPAKIGIITSAAGAVLRDIYNVSKRRYPSVQLVLAPVQVQGNEAAGQIVAAIKLFNDKYPVDVIIVGRGGGSIEDLWAFNEEVLVRAIFDSKIPIISAVGHETDTTLADYAADVRAATPSQAAELAVPDRQDLIYRINSLYNQLRRGADRQLSLKNTRLERCRQEKWYTKPQILLAPYYQAFDQVNEELHNKVKVKRDNMRVSLQHLTEKLGLLNPIQVLFRGYAIAEKNDQIVSRAAEINPGDEIQLTFTDGKISVVAK